MCPQCSAPTIKGLCPCGFRFPDVGPKTFPPWWLFTCTQCGYDKAYRSDYDKKVVVCRRCREGPSVSYLPNPTREGRQDSPDFSPDPNSRPDSATITP
jgi:hypothetical protein